MRPEPVSRAAGGALALLVAALVVALPTPDEAELALERRADCLWYSARNHGFHDVQARAVAGPDRSDEARPSGPTEPRALWARFLAGPGRRDCGESASSPARLADALRERLPEARRLLGVDAGREPGALHPEPGHDAVRVSATR